MRGGISSPRQNWYFPISHEFFLLQGLLVRRMIRKIISSACSESSATCFYRIAVVTGANKGIGLEVCRQLAFNGVKVILTARDETKGMEALEKMRDSELSDIIFHQLDVTDASSIASLADFIRTQFGKLDILVRKLSQIAIMILTS